MIVVDASAVLELLLDQPGAGRVRERVIVAGELAAPHLLDAEVGQVLRRFVGRGSMRAQRAEGALADLLDLPLLRYPHHVLLRRAFAMRDNVTVYDALYLALAEALDRPLLTADQALARVPGVRAHVEVLPRPAG